jgi:hypothetical protein
MKKLLSLTALAILSTQVNAAQLEITINNATAGTAFTPFAVSAHNMGGDFYNIGEKASDALIAMAEGGNVSPLIETVNMSGAGMASQQNPVDGLTLPGMSQSFMVDSMDYKYLSVVAMLLPTNDGFVGLDSWMIPEKPGTYTIKLDGYDAGSELNDEIVNGGGAPGNAGIPAAPTGMEQSGGMVYPNLSENGYVHTHPGVVGDTDEMGGYSDLDSRVHRFLNPVASITITVMPEEWANNVKYTRGAVVKFEDITYSAKWGQKGKTPGMTAAWAVIN